VRPASARETVRKAVAGAVQDLAGQGFLAAGAADVPVSIERTKRPEHGDFASNVALTLAKPAGKPPRVVAEAIVARLAPGLGATIAEATIAGPGFINVRLASAFWHGKLGEVLAARAHWGRHAAVGDALARLLRFAGYPVTTEFYINDAGNQVAADFQSYYTRLQKTHGDTILPQERHRVGDWRASWNWRKTAARLWWVEAIAQVMRNGLALLGVSAPESMPRSETTTKEDES